MATLMAQNHALTIVEADDLHVGVLVSTICACLNILYNKISEERHHHSSVFPIKKGKIEPKLVKFWDPENQLLGSTKTGMSRSYPKDTFVSFHPASDDWTIDPKKLKSKRNLLGQGKGWSTVPNIGTPCLPGRNFRGQRDNPDHLAEENGAWTMMIAGTTLWPGLLSYKTSRCLFKFKPHARSPKMNWRALDVSVPLLNVDTLTNCTPCILHYSYMSL